VETYAFIYVILAYVAAASFFGAVVGGWLAALWRPKVFRGLSVFVKKQGRR
jgi:uncharacterized membrane protein YfcA